MSLVFRLGDVEFNLAKFNFVLKLEEPAVLPEYKGSTLRGGFGVTLKKLCCFQRKKICSECLLREKCFYSITFESFPFKINKNYSIIKEIPRPFVLEPPLEKKTQYSKFEELIFSLILFGKAVGYLPYIIYTFIELGKIGIGKKRTKFTLKEVRDFKDNLIYDSISETMRNIDSSFCCEIKEFNKTISTLKLTFLTPTRIKYNGHYTDNPEFHIIIRALLRRISALLYFYCDQELKVDFKYLILKSKNVKIIKNETKWVDWERYSSRQNTKMKLGGFIGEVVYEGEFKDFLGLLQIGEYTHIGKNCTFGLGKYVLRGSI